MPFVVINPNQTDAKSPVDDNLMDTIRADLDYLNSAIVASAAQPFDFRVPGDLTLSTIGTGQISQPFIGGAQPKKRVDTAYISKTQTLVRSKIYLETPAVAGKLIVDVRKYKPQQTPIEDITPLYQDTLSANPALAYAPVTCQGVQEATPIINTQSITQYKAAINIESVIPWRSNNNTAGTAMRKFNLASAPDDDWIPGSYNAGLIQRYPGYIGDSVVVSGTASNDGTYTILGVNVDGGRNIVVSGAGTREESSSGTITLQAWSFNFANPVDANFFPGEKATATGHTSGSNDGAWLIYKINDGGNNIIFKYSGGVAQGAAAGTVECRRYLYTLSAPADATMFPVGDVVHYSSFPNSNNNFDRQTIAINVGGNNILSYARNGAGENPRGAVDPTVGGDITPYLWQCALPSDPTGLIAIGHHVIMDWASGVQTRKFEVRDVNLGGNDIVFYDVGIDYTTETGPFVLTTTRMKVRFDQDWSSIYTTASRIDIESTRGEQTKYFNGDFDVVDVNFGGGANYNVVIETKVQAFSNLPGTPRTQPYAGGVIVAESRSIFTTRPTIVFQDYGYAPGENFITGYSTLGGKAERIARLNFMQVEDGVLGAEAACDDGDILCMNLDQIPHSLIGGVDNSVPVRNLMLQLG